MARPDKLWGTEEEGRKIYASWEHSLNEGFVEALEAFRGQGDMGK